MRSRLSEAIRFHFRQRQALPSASGSNGGAATSQGDFMEHGKLRFLNNSRELQGHCTETRIMLLYKCCRTPDRTAGARGTFMNAKPKMAKSAQRSTQSGPTGVPTRHCRKATHKPARPSLRRGGLRETSQSSFDSVGLRRGVILVEFCVSGVHVGEPRVGSSQRIVPPRYDSSIRVRLTGHGIARRAVSADVVPPFHGSV